MKKVIKKQWVEALRSGKYEQGKGALCDGQGRYCCLGVLSELAVQAGKAEKWRQGNSNSFFGKKRGDFSTAFLPTSVRRWAGLDTTDPSVPGQDGYGHEYLSVLNDSGKPFSEIADLIEKHL